MVTADRALPGRDARDAGARAPLRPRHAAAPAVSRRLRSGRRRDGLLLGRRARLLAGPRRLHDRGRLRGRVHAEPDLRGGLLGLDRPHRGGARRLRSGGDLLRGDAAPVLGEPRPDPGDAPGQRRRHPVPLGDLLPRRRPSRPPRSAPATPTRRCCGPAATARSRPRSRPPARSTTPRTTTSSTWPRTRAATAAWAAPASAARSGSAARSATARRSTSRSPRLLAAPATGRSPRAPARGARCRAVRGPDLPATARLTRRALRAVVTRRRC